jgi:hypothetical protein
MTDRPSGGPDDSSPGCTYSAEPFGDVPQGHDGALWWLVAACTALSLDHHVDHVLRDATGWPFHAHSTSAFAFSLLVDAAIGVLIVSPCEASLGPVAGLCSPASTRLISAVHFGPVAGDTISMVRNGYSTAVAGTAALGWIAAQLTALTATCGYAALRSTCH